MNDTATPTESSEQTPELAFPTVEAWVDGWLRHIYAQPLTGRGKLWSSKWWENPGALSRLQALWRAWEALRQDPGTGLAQWYIQFGDPMIRTLLDPDGPFNAIDPNDPDNLAGKGDPLPHTQPPEALFNTPPTTQPTIDVDLDGKPTSVNTTEEHATNANPPT